MTANSASQQIVKAVEDHYGVWRFVEGQAVEEVVNVTLDALTKAGFTVKPPCVECDVHWPCRMVNDSESLGECALATAANGDGSAT